LISNNLSVTNALSISENILNSNKFSQSNSEIGKNEQGFFYKLNCIRQMILSARILKYVLLIINDKIFDIENK